MSFFAEGHEVLLGFGALRTSRRRALEGVVGILIVGLLWSLLRVLERRFLGALGFALRGAIATVVGRR